MNKDSYRVWVRDDWGMDYVCEIQEVDVPEVMATFQVVVCGRSVIVQ